MEHYKISQTAKKIPVPAKLKSFWVSKGQKKTLSPRAIFGTIGVAVVVIGIGVAVVLLFKNRAPVHKSSSIGLPASNSPKNPLYTVSQPTFVNVTNGVTAKNLTILGSNCASQVQVVIVNSHINETVSCSTAESLVNNALDGAVNPWNFHVMASEIASWQNGPYGQAFDGNDVIGESANGEVISIQFNTSGQITSVTLAPSNSLPGTPSNSSGSSSSSGGTTTNPSQTPTPSPADAQD